MTNKIENGPLPQPTTVDKDWAERIKKALEAREQGKELRKGKVTRFVAGRWNRMTTRTKSRASHRYSTPSKRIGTSDSG